MNKLKLLTNYIAFFEIRHVLYKSSMLFYQTVILSEQNTSIADNLSPRATA
jgi:uncharacterized membrane protein YobD (UPF0266 family)